MEDGRALYFEGIKKFFDGNWKDAEESFSRASLLNYAPATNVCRCHLAECGFCGETRLSLFKTDWFDVEGMIYIAELNYEKEYYPQAFAWYKVAAERGSGAGYYGMASLYFGGIGVNADSDKGMEMLIESAKLGYAKAEYFLAKSLLDAEDYTNALPLLMSAATKEHPDAQYLLSLCYMKGLGVETNAELSSKWCVEAANAGHPDAQFSVGVYLYDLQKYEDAVAWLNASAEQGNPDAQYLLSLCYLKGLGVETNAELFSEWCAEAANAGHPDAQYMLGTIYYKEQEHENAVYWFRAAADQGHPAAQCELAGYALVAKDNDEFLHLLKSSADQGYVPAVFKLGVAFYAGAGVEKNFSSALRYFRQAAEAGQAEAQHYLALMYLRGEGVGENMDTAIYWFGKAHSQGYRESTKILYEIRNALIDSMKSVSKKQSEIAKKRLEELKRSYYSSRNNSRYIKEFERAAQQTYSDAKIHIKNEVDNISALIKKIDNALGI